MERVRVRSAAPGSAWHRLKAGAPPPPPPRLPALLLPSAPLLKSFFVMSINPQTTHFTDKDKEVDPERSAEVLLAAEPASG